MQRLNTVIDLLGRILVSDEWSRYGTLGYGDISPFQPIRARMRGRVQDDARHWNDGHWYRAPISADRV